MLWKSKEFIFTFWPIPYNKTQETFSFLSNNPKSATFLELTEDMALNLLFFFMLILSHRGFYTFKCEWIVNLGYFWWLTLYTLSISYLGGQPK